MVVPFRYLYMVLYLSYFLKYETLQRNFHIHSTAQTTIFSMRATSVKRFISSTRASLILLTRWSMNRLPLSGAGATLVRMHWLRVQKDDLSLSGHGAGLMFAV